MVKADTDYWHAPNIFTMHVELDNAAFEGDPKPELARILRHEADRMERGDYYRGHSQTILDVNGNDVGRGKIHPER